MATGIARVINDPTEAMDLEPGEILVAPITDPGWTPLFTSAEAVVVNVGSTMSHAAIVSRELGIPCVLGVPNATRSDPQRRHAHRGRRHRPGHRSLSEHRACATARLKSRSHI